MADFVEKVEKFESQNFRRNPAKPRIPAATPIEVIYSDIRGDAGILAVPPATISNRPPVRLRFFRRLRKKTFSTKSALFEHQAALG